MAGAWRIAHLDQLSPGVAVLVLGGFIDISLRHWPCTHGGCPGTWGHADVDDSQHTRPAVWADHAGDSPRHPATRTTATTSTHRPSRPGVVSHHRDQRLIQQAGGTTPPTQVAPLWPRGRSLPCRGKKFTRDAPQAGPQKPAWQTLAIVLDIPDRKDPSETARRRPRESYDK
jgi:hypothetical protein